MKVFDAIYKYNLWIFGSGSGSLAINNKPYIKYLKNFLKNNNIKTVVDIGCGDWQISENIDWTNIKYLGGFMYSYAFFSQERSRGALSRSALAANF